MPKSKESEAEDQRILEEAKKRFDLCVEAEREGRLLALDDLNFRAGEQWPESIRARRETDKKPCLTINVLPSRERQILNDQRQNRPAIKVSPVDDTADPDTAEVIQGMVRHIEYDSNADVAYDTAFAAAVRGGFGYFRLVTEYESETSDRQVIKIKRIRNPFMVYMDPMCQEPDYSDAEYGFIFEFLLKAEYLSLSPKTYDGEDSMLVSMTDWNSIGDRDPDWISDKGVRVVEYFRKVHDGRKTKIEWYKLNQKEINEKTKWQGRWIPIIPVLGDELDVDGKRILEGMVRHAKDPCRMQNYMASAEVQAIALAPDAPYIAAAGQIQDFEQQWKNLNTGMNPVLPYSPISVNGILVPPPKREVSEPAIQAISQSRQQFANDFRDVTGIYEAQYGARSNEKSGIAIREKTNQGQLSNFHFLDNLTRAIRFLGLQVIDLIPKIYNEARVMRIIGEDGTQKTVKINQEFDQGGISKIYDLTVGRYDVTVTAGPSYQTKRQAAVDAMIEFIKAYPALAAVASDLLVKFMDFPGHEELADRLRKTLPPGIVDDDGTDPKIALQSAQAKLQALGQQHDQLTQALNQAQDIIKGKQIENQGRLDVEKLHAETQVTVAEINAKAQDAMKRAQFEFDMWKLTHQTAHDTASQAMDAQQQQSLAQQSQEHDMTMTAADQAHQQEMAAQQQQEVATQ